MTEEAQSRHLGSTQNAAPVPTTVKRNELFELHTSYVSVIKDELDFFFRYLHFYIGLLSAILAGTLTGLLGLSEWELEPALKLALLLGPILVIVLGYTGYSTLKIHFRRFLQAWITVINIRAMLGLTGSVTLDEGLRSPPYTSKHDGGFIAQFRRARSVQILVEGEEQGWSSEELMEKMLEHGESLQLAKITFLAFGIAAALLCVVITIAAVPSL